MDAQFCDACGAAQAAEASPAPVSNRKKNTRKALWWLLGPMISFIVILALWGFLAILANIFGFQDSAAYKVAKLIISVIILISAVLTPTGIIAGIVLLAQRTKA